ncbi:WDPCP.2 family protein [Megaselia abdita]
MSGDIHNSGLTADVLVNRYLLLNQFEKAVNLMMCINWESYGAMSLMSLHKIANFIFTKNDLKKPGLEMLSAALKTFTDDLSEETKDEFGDQIFDLRRRFFLFLLRHEMFIDAFQEGLRIEDYDLFMDLYNVTNEKHDISQAAYRQAAILLNEDDENPISSSSCSYSSCSNCTTPTKTAAVTSTENYVPPLPSFKVSTSKIYSTEHINIPKPEYRRPKQQTPPDQVLDQTLGIPVSLTVPRPSTSAIPPMPYYGPKYYQYPLVSGTIPPPIKSPSPEEMQRTLQKKPAASILSNNNNNGWTNNGYGGPSSSAYSQNGNGYVKKDNTTGEQKNKVKFSDTVQVAVVPEITRKDKSSLQQKRIFNNIRHPPPRNYTNPRKELADSLPLCHPHGEYLKDFDPVDPESIQVPRHPSTNNSSSNRATNELNSKSSTSSIKVVQFGVV